MSDVAFVTAAEPGRLDSLVAATRAELERQGMPTSLHHAFPESDPQRLYVLAEPRRFVAARGHGALPDEALLRRTVLLGAEDPSALSGDRDLDLYTRAGHVFDIDQRAVEEFHRIGIPARLLRPGYCPEWDRFDADAARPTDVLFLASHSRRRTRLLSDAADVLARWRCEIHVVEPGRLDLAARLEALGRARVALNLHASEGRRIEWTAMVEAMHAGAVMVSEHATGFSPFVAGEHLLLGSAASVPEVLDAVLRDDARLTRVRVAAHARLSGWLPFAVSVAVLRAALLELIGRPLSLPGRTAPPPLTIDDGERARPTATPSDETVDEMAAEIRALRRQVRRLSDAVHDERSAGGPDAPAEPMVNAAWTTSAPPAVTVFVAGPRDGERWLPTLESLLPTIDGAELVVVTPGPAPIALREWLADHDEVPAIGVAVGPSEVPGRALNRALEVARAPACLLVDPGQVLYPRCLPALRETLEASPEAPYVSATEAITSASPSLLAAGGDHLLGLGELPGRLAERDDIAAPALVRTAALRELDGFTEDPTLVGYERYDLWCRMAERGWSGAFVAEILSRDSGAHAEEAIDDRRPAAGAVRATLAGRSPVVFEVHAPA